MLRNRGYIVEESGELGKLFDELSSAITKNDQRKEKSGKWHNPYSLSLHFEAMKRARQKAEDLVRQGKTPGEAFVISVTDTFTPAPYMRTFLRKVDPSIDVSSGRWIRKKATDVVDASPRRRSFTLTKEEMGKLKPLIDLGYQSRLPRDTFLKEFVSSYVFLKNKDDQFRKDRFTEIAARVLREWVKTGEKIPISFAENVFKKADIDKIASPNDHGQWMAAIRRVIEVTNEIIDELQIKQGKQESTQSLRRRGYITEDYSALISNPAHKPKEVAKQFVQLLKPLGKVKVIKAEATAPRGWEYGFYGLFEITKDGEPVKLALSLNMAEDEIGGNVSADAPHGVIAMSNRLKNLDKVLSYMAGDVVSHFGK